MKVLFKDVAHFYLQCNCKFFPKNSAPYVGTLTPAYLGDLEGVIPILKPIDKIERFDEQELMTEFTGSDKGMQWYARLSWYLCKKGYDIFGLIEGGEAINHFEHKEEMEKS